MNKTEIDELFKKVEEIFYDKEREKTYSSNPKYRNEEEVALIKEIIKAMGKVWVAVALIHGSIGYHSARSAELVIKAIEENRYYGCERTSACFEGDLVYEVLRDCYCLNRDLSYEEDTRTKKIVQAMLKKYSEMLEWDNASALTFGLLYPTV